MTGADPGQEQECVTINELLNQDPFCSSKSPPQTTKARIGHAVKIATGEALKDKPINVTDLPKVIDAYNKLGPPIENLSLRNLLTLNEISIILKSANLYHYNGHLYNAMDKLRRNKTLQPTRAMIAHNLHRPVYYYSVEEIKTVIEEIANRYLTSGTTEEEKSNAISLFNEEIIKKAMEERNQI